MNRDLERNRSHYNLPAVGDYWHEMFCPYFIVLEVLSGTGYYVICEDRKTVDSDHWTFDLSKAKWVDKSYFNMVKYTTMDGFCADVVVNPKYQVFVEEWIELGKPVVQSFDDWRASLIPKPPVDFWKARKGSEKYGLLSQTIVLTDELVKLTPECEWEVFYKRT